MQAADSVMAIEKDFLVRVERAGPIGDLVGGMELGTGEMAQSVFLRIAHVDHTRRAALLEQGAQLFGGNIAEEFFSHRRSATGWG